MRIQISDHFTVGKLLRFVFPSIIMMIFTSIYGVVDGFFVSNYVGKTPFAAVNLIMPLLMAVGAIGFMLGSGGSALVAKTCGEGDAKRANRYFSMVIYAAVIIGFAAALVCFFLIRPIASMMGARGEMLEYCVLYARILIFTLPMFMLQNMFQSFFITAEKPHLGLYVILAAGVANMVLDFLFIVVFHWGLGRRSCGDRNRRDYRRCRAVDLLCTSQHQPVETGADKAGMASAVAQLLQRCVGNDDEPVHVHCEYTVQSPADAFCR